MARDTRKRWVEVKRPYINQCRPIGPGASLWPSMRRVRPCGFSLTPQSHETKPWMQSWPLHSPAFVIISVFPHREPLLEAVRNPGLLDVAWNQEIWPAGMHGRLQPVGAKLIRSSEKDKKKFQNENSKKTPGNSLRSDRSGSA